MLPAGTRAEKIVELYDPIDDMSALYRLYLGVTDGISIARACTCRYSK